MSIAETKENIVILLENIIKRSEIIERQTGSKNLLEIDMAMEDIRLLYREMDRLRKFIEVENIQNRPGIREINMASSEKSENHEPFQESSNQHTPTQKNEPVVPAAEPDASVKVVEHQIAKKDEEKVVEVTEHPPAPHAKEPVEEVPKPEKTPEPLRNPTAEANPIQPEQQLQTTIKKAGILVGEKFSSEKSSVHERLAQIKDDTSIGARMQSKPVSNLKEAIGLNEKFLFINELFNGDINAYNESINQLNSRESIHQAFEMLNGLTSEYNWDGKRSGETIDKFANLVQRRYM